MAKRDASEISAGMERVCLVGSGNWGSAIARICGAVRIAAATTRRSSFLTQRDAQNAARLPNFVDEVRMWVYEEMIDGQKLTDIINTTHENVKYLPGAKLPENVVAVPDLGEAVDGATILVFVIPHQV